MSEKGLSAYGALRTRMSAPQNGAHSMKRLLVLTLLLIAGLSFVSYSILAQERTDAPSSPKPSLDLWQQVEIIRTAHGVPHIRAENLRAAGYALAWVQLEDYGPRTAMNVLKAHAGMGRV